MTKDNQLNNKVLSILDNLLNFELATDDNEENYYIKICGDYFSISKKDYQILKQWKEKENG